ncbi:nitrogenase stabilizing/protective protein NifW [Rhodoblastus sp.]|uniref:nitrogenase stabilizing/protective protein NifW n=1 Tax=Rhodoblastus sp. TaxID=1962975 RepID=UPI00260C1B30|nr:nitrogenase stabilizing/protective protein NifW [Rhodoblastus sp.]
MSPILDKLKNLSAAEEFFEALGVAYDAKIVSVSRLHILKRMGQHIASLTSGDEAETVETCRAALQAAYAEFEARSPIETRLFKVLKDRDPSTPGKPGQAFVPLSDLTTL